MRSFFGFGLLGLLALVGGVHPSSAQPDRPYDSAREPESDSISLIPTSIKTTKLTLDVNGRTLVVPVQYSVRQSGVKDRPTLFVLPVWVVEKAERGVGDAWLELKPADPLLPPDGGMVPGVRLRVTIRNLLDDPQSERLVLEQLKRYVAEQLGLDQPVFRAEKPHLDSREVRFTLIGPGWGDEPEIPLSNAVASASGLLGMDLDVEAIRRCERYHRYKGGLALGNTTLLPSGPMKVRFERLEFEAQMRYLRAAVSELRKRVGSAVGSPTSPPDVIISFSSGGLADASNHITSLLKQSLHVVVSTRQGASDLPLLPILDKAVASLIRQQDVDLSHDNQRLLLLVNNQVSLSATLGEFKRLQSLDEKSRTAALRQAYDRFRASQYALANSSSLSEEERNQQSTSEQRSRGGSLNVGGSQDVENSYSVGSSHNVGGSFNVGGSIHVGYGLISGGGSYHQGSSFHHSDSSYRAGASRNMESSYKSGSYQSSNSNAMSQDSQKKKDQSQSDSRSEASAQRDQEDWAALQQSSDQLMKCFEGNVKLPTGLCLDDQALTRSVKDLQAEFTHRSFFMDYTLHRFEPIPLSGSTDLGRDAGALLRQYAQLKADHDAVLVRYRQALAEHRGLKKELDEAAAQLDLAREKQLQIQEAVEGLVKAAGKPEQWADAKTQMERVLKQVAELDQKLTALEKSLTGSDASRLAGLQKQLGELSQDLSRLKTNVDGLSQMEKRLGDLGQDLSRLQTNVDGLSQLEKQLANLRQDQERLKKRVRLVPATLQGHTEYVRSVAFSPDGKTLASGSADKTIRLWDMGSGEEIHTLKGHTGYVRSVAFSPDGKTLASASEDCTVRLWDLTLGQPPRMLFNHTHYMRCVAFSPDGKRLASGSDDKTIRLWDVASGQEIRTLEGHESVVWSVAFSPDGKTLASGSDDKTIRLWDLTSGQELRTLEGHEGPVWSVVFSPDGKTLASGSDDNTIRLWDVASGRHLNTFRGHTNSVSSVAFSPDGKTLASGSYDNTIRLWDLASGQHLSTLTGHQDAVRSVAFSPDGALIASGSFDKTIRLRAAE